MIKKQRIIRFQYILWTIFIKINQIMYTMMTNTWIYLI
jgi:hypothetical protein